ncbi:MAG: 1-deoxy-D-xylulose-5-phosphate synthase [Planctomycetes bacterium RBG_16_43_13]|nr:MAG: 1-deoxy-D-xylulose-5-phosphate synthase [Planctomycetes bacterium RBG_16_43_13]
MGSNLGVVELTLALHYVFDVDNDIFVWDVSNQTYVHKILTGRKERLNTIRQYKGLSGFGNKEESKYDPFTFGHAGTAISTALGIVCGDDLLNNNRKVVAITGDGAITAGMSYEALNNCGHLKKNLLVVLNDNGMSISPTVGAISNYLNTLRTVPLYDEVKKEIYNLLNKIPLVGTPVEHTLERIRNMIKASVGWNLFSALGFQYYGPIDGHNVKLLIKTFHNIRHQKKPVLLHIMTRKGKGHPDVDKDPMALHGISPKSKESKVEGGVAPLPKVSYTKAFAKSAVQLAEKDKKVVAITAAMPEGTGLVDFANAFPDRYFDVGICEQHAVALAAGIAHAGAKPIAAIYSTFLQRGYDQVFQEVCLQNLPVVFALDRAGIAGADGPTHNGLFDIAYLRTLPNIVLMAPKDGAELDKMLEFSLTLKQPSAIRYPRANIPDFTKYVFKDNPLEVGRAEMLLEGRDVAIVAYGAMVEIALKAAELLKAESVSVGVVNARFAKPFDEDIIAALVQKYSFIVTLEEHALVGGFGSAVLETVSKLQGDLQRVKILAVPDKFIEHGERNQLIDVLGLDAKGVANTVKCLLSGAKLPQRAVDLEQTLEKVVSKR